MLSVCMGDYFTPPLKLTFDPKELDTLVKNVYEDDIARTLWLAIKPKHLCGPDFPQHCLNTAAYIREQGTPDSAEGLHKVLHGHFGYPPFDMALVEQLLPYLHGETLEYVVNT